MPGKMQVMNVLYLSRQKKAVWKSISLQGIWITLIASNVFGSKQCGKIYLAPKIHQTKLSFSRPERI